jgi:thioredoxin 1
MPAGTRVVLAEARSCVECKRMAPLVEGVAAAHPDVLFERVDVSSQTATARALRVTATPTLIGFAGDAEVARLAGRRGRHEIERLFAATASGTRPPPRTSGFETALRAAAGALLVALGVLAGPSWPLVAVGAGVGGYGLAGHILSRRR